MKEHPFRANGHENERSGREAFDFVSEGARYGLAPGVSLTLWDHARQEATDHYGWCDPVRAREIFLEKARRTGQGGLSGAVPGKTTLVLGRKSGAGHPDPGRTSLIIEQARRERKGAYTPDESLGLFQTAMTGSRAGLVNLARAIVAVDYGAALQASAKLRQDLASARAHLANGHADNESLRNEFSELEGLVNNLLAKMPVMSRGAIDAARGPRGSWTQWNQEIANGRAVLAMDTEMREFARAIELAAVVAPPAMSVELATAVSSNELGRSSTAPHMPSPPLDPGHADAHDPLGEPKIDKKGADPRKQARRGEPSRWPPLLSPGKRALTDGMGGVQMKRTPGSAASTDAVHDAAARGVFTTTTALPFGDRIQESFGPEHDISKIVAHIGSDAPRAMGAEAFAFGSHVVFGAPPDLHTAAHEAAHVIQQAHGVNLHGGVGEAGDAYERQADAVADRVVAGLPAADLLGSATRSATPQSTAVQMKEAAHTPAKQCDFVIPLPQDSFTVSFELLSAEAGDVRVVIAPANFSRAYQSEMKYWDVRGREVDQGDSYVSMGNWSVPAQPHQQMTRIATPAKFDPIDLKRLSEPSGTVWTFDLDGDGKPDFAVHIDFTIGNTLREYSFTTTNNQSAEKFGFHFVQDDAYKYGYQGNSAPRREKDDFVDALKAPLEMAVVMIPVIGEIVLTVEAITGRSMFGEKLSTTERVVAGVAALLPVAGGLIAKGIGRAGADLAKLASKLGRSEEEVMALLRAVDKESAETGKIKQWEATLKGGGKLGASEVAELQRIVRQIEADERVFRSADQEAARATRDAAEVTELEKEGEELLSLCFPAGTLVQSPAGAISIERIVPGMVVYSWDIERHMAVTRRIVDVQRHRTFRLIGVRVAGAVVEATPKHPFFRVDDSCWVPAAALEPGASVMGLRGEPLRIEAVTDRTLDAPTTVYSLSVEANPTYFVGDAAVWVHNAPPPTAPSLPEKVIYDDGMVRVWHNFGNMERAPGTMVEHAPIHFHARLANNARVEYQLFPSGVKLSNSPAPPEAIVDVFRANRSRFDRVAKRIGKWYRHWTTQCS